MELRCFIDWSHQIRLYGSYPFPLDNYLDSLLSTLLLIPILGCLLFDQFIAHYRSSPRPRIILITRPCLVLKIMALHHYSSFLFQYCLLRHFINNFSLITVGVFMAFGRITGHHFSNSDYSGCLIQPSVKRALIHSSADSATGSWTRAVACSSPA